MLILRINFSPTKNKTRTGKCFQYLILTQEMILLLVSKATSTCEIPRKRQRQERFSRFHPISFPVEPFNIGSHNKLSLFQEKLAYSPRLCKSKKKLGLCNTMFTCFFIAKDLIKNFVLSAILWLFS